MSRPPFTWSLLAPRWWPSWILLGLIGLLSWLPIHVQLVLGEGLGWLTGRLLRRRRRVVQVNLRLCLPELSAGAIEALTDRHFRALGAGVFETALVWWAPDWRMKPRLSVEGGEHLQAALAQKRGLLLLTGHFTTLEMGARAVYLAAGLPFHAMYRPTNDAVVNFLMHRMRQRRSGLPAVPRDDLRGIVKALRAGRAIWYAPDQTLHGRDNVFVPFFGVPALTVTATSRLAQMGRAAVLPYFPERRGGHWHIRFLPALENFPTGDDTADTARILQIIEAGARRALPQYLWMHRRFKRRPPGEPSAYKK